MPGIHTEHAFETAIEHYLLNHGGYEKGNKETFDRERCIDPAVFLSFVQETQPVGWAKLEKLCGTSAGKQLIDDLCHWMDKVGGSLAILRHGFKCMGMQFRAVYFKPAHGINPDILKLYDANRLTITRQVHYDPNSEKSIDAVLSVNGIPVVTVELKNQLTGQTVEDAVKQYCKDRSPAEKIFRPWRRTLAQFAVDADEVQMTTELAMGDTVFLPFNKGVNDGAGNPENPDGWETAYLWEQALSRDSLLDMIHRFLHIQKEEKKGKTREKMIFPRYHQLDAVRKMVADAKAGGAGRSCLIQHSAGSGKTNTIAWLAHHLATLHTDGNEKIYDSVIVVSDRVVIDKQLQDAVYQFEHKAGMIACIKDQGKANQLAEALDKKTPIIITTLQTFPFVAEKISDLKRRRFAVIIDEAHSSQGGTASEGMKAVLGDPSDPEIEDGMPDYQEEIIRAISKKGKQPNLSFFAFTATPIYKTIEFFGRRNSEGEPEPFHVYSMKQAIQEGFILDVLANYTTYQDYYRLVQADGEDLEVHQMQAAKALIKYVHLHEKTIRSKAEVIVEHFREKVMHKIGGRAKAMVVTASRPAVLRYKLAIDGYIKEKGYGIKTLVAFSGTVKHPVTGEDCTEEKMNGFKEKELPDKFDGDEYRTLIVAEKYQTGFDQPLLHTMYVDKKLSGVHAVQTLSRLNRCCPGKGDTFVLDFENTTEEIQKAFDPFYKQTTVASQVDPRRLYEIEAKLNGYAVISPADVEELCSVFYKKKEKQSAQDHARINAALDPTVGRWNDLDEDSREEFRAALTAFRNMYRFLCQVMDFADQDLEKLYTYGRFLLKKLPKPPKEPVKDLDDDVSLEFYRLEKIKEGEKIQLDGDGSIGPPAFGETPKEDDMIELSRLIKLLNERFGTDFNDADRLFFKQVQEEAVANEDLQQFALADNTLKQFGYKFNEVLQKIFIERLNSNQDIVSKYLDDGEFKRLVEDNLVSQVYNRIRQEGVSAALEQRES